MIRSFADRETERLSRGIRSRKLPPGIQNKALRLLRQMIQVEDWNALRFPATTFMPCLATEPVNMLHGSISGAGYELLEARQELNDALDRIVPRAV